MDDEYGRCRRDMVKSQLAERGITNLDVLRAMSIVPRHAFVPPDLLDRAYTDTPLPIGQNQTISQPFIVAYMTQMLAPEIGERVLEIGTGCGYQTAVLAEMGARVYSVEILESLSHKAAKRLDELGYHAHFRVGDGHAGWPEQAPFDKILAACCAETLPEQLVTQLKSGGRMIIPLGRDTQHQALFQIQRDERGALSYQKLMGVRFVPFVHDA